MAYRVTRTDAEWRRILNPAQYQVLRQRSTERAFTSPLNQEKRRGVFRCAGCRWPVFASTDKYESGTGWPSFKRPYNAAATRTSIDRSLFSVRTEVHCANCGGHLGHMFPDGPPPTFQRWCMNGVAMTFEPR